MFRLSPTITDYFRVKDYGINSSRKCPFFSSKDSSKSKCMLFLNNIRFILMLCIVIMPGILVIDMHLAFKISPFEIWYSDMCGILNVE